MVTLLLVAFFNLRTSFGSTGVSFFNSSSSVIGESLLELVFDLAPEVLPEFAFDGNNVDAIEIRFFSEIKLRNATMLINTER